MKVDFCFRVLLLTAKFSWISSVLEAFYELKFFDFDDLDPCELFSCTVRMCCLLDAFSDNLSLVFLMLLSAASV